MTVTEAGHCMHSYDVQAASETVTETGPAEPESACTGAATAVPARVTATATGNNLTLAP